ncbi:MAG: hypothetical protein WCO63_01845 [Bacteroidota bacterium]
MAHQKFRIVLIMGVFLALIAFPLINGTFHLFHDVQSAENRSLAKKPLFNPEDPDDFPGRYEKYYNDDFSMRTMLVNNYNHLVYGLFHRSPVPDKVIVGKSGWLFTAGDEDALFFDKSPWLPDELTAFRDELNYRIKVLDSLGIKYYFLIAPLKAEIYPEYVIGSGDRKNQKSMGEELIEFLNHHGIQNTVNAYNTLRIQKLSGNQYYKTDNHWTQLGAFYSANAVLSRIHQDFPTIKPLDLNDFVITKTDYKAGNLAKMMSGVTNLEDIHYDLKPRSVFQSVEVAKHGYPVPRMFAYPKDYEIVRETKDTTKLMLLLISDSFGATIFPFLSERFHHSVKIFDAWQYMLNKDIVLSEKPDVVVLMVHEARLRLMLEHRELGE